MKHSSFPWILVVSLLATPLTYSAAHEERERDPQRPLSPTSALAAQLAALQAQLSAQQDQLNHQATKLAEQEAELHRQRAAAPPENPTTPLDQAEEGQSPTVGEKVQREIGRVVNDVVDEANRVIPKVEKETNRVVTDVKNEFNRWKKKGFRL